MNSQTMHFQNSRNEDSIKGIDIIDGILISNVVFIHTYYNQAEIYTNDGLVITKDLSLRNVDEYQDLLLIHPNFIVNITLVKEINIRQNSSILVGGYCLPMDKRYLASVQGFVDSNIIKS